MLFPTLFLLAAAVPPQLHEVDEIDIDAARYGVTCTPQEFIVSLDAFGTAKGTQPLLPEQVHRCESGGAVFEAHIGKTRSNAGYCAGATAGNIDVTVNGRPILDGLFADYCRGAGFTAFRFAWGRLSACGFGEMPGSPRGERIAGCVDYGDLETFADAGLRIAGDPFDLIEDPQPHAGSRTDAGRQAECEHWLGEEPYDEERAKEIAEAIKRTCGSGSE